MTIKPAIVFHPGEYIKDELQTRGRSQKILSDITGKSTNEINELINGKRNISPRRAILLGTAFGTSEEIRLGLQNEYDIHKAKNIINSDILDQIKIRASKYFMQDVTYSS